MSGRAARGLTVALAASALVAVAASSGVAARADAPPEVQRPTVDIEIMNANTGGPVSGAHVRFFRQEDGRTVAQLITDRSGTAWTRLDYGQYRYVVTKQGFQQMRGSVPIEPPRDGQSVGLWNINLILTPGFTPITEDVSLCSDLLNQYQAGTVYVVCNGR
jgi:hypothetical protein